MRITDHYEGHGVIFQKEWGLNNHGVSPKGNPMCSQGGEVISYQLICLGRIIKEIVSVSL